MASPGSVVFQFKAIADKAKSDVLDFAKSLGKVDDASRVTDAKLDTLGAGFDAAAADARQAATNMATSARDMASGVHTGAVGIGTETANIRTNMSETGKEAGAEFIGNIAEGIGSGQANLTDVVTGTLGGITNLAATIAGPVGIAAAGAAAGIGLVFASVKGQSEATKAEIGTLIGALEEVGTTSGKIAKGVIWDTWLKKMQENRGELGKIVDALKTAGIDAETFKSAITGSAKAQEEVRTKLFLTGGQLIKNQTSGKGITDAQKDYLANFPTILKQLGNQNKELDGTQEYFDDINFLTDDAEKKTRDWKSALADAKTQTGKIKDDLEALDHDRNVTVTVTVKDKKGREVDPNTGQPRAAIRSGPTAPTATTSAAPTVRVATLNFYGSGDVAADAARLKRILESDDVRQGRGRGQPLRVAW